MLGGCGLRTGGFSQQILPICQNNPLGTRPFSRPAWQEWGGTHMMSLRDLPVLQARFLPDAIHLPNSCPGYWGTQGVGRSIWQLCVQARARGSRILNMILIC